MQALFDVPEIKARNEKKQKEYANAEMIIRRFKNADLDFPLVLIASSLAGCIERANELNYTPSQIIKSEIEIKKKAKEWYNMQDDFVNAFLYLYKKHRNDTELAKELRKYYKDNADENEVREYLSTHKKDENYKGKK